MDKQYNKVFLSGEKESTMWMIGLSALYMLGLALQVTYGSEVLVIYVSIFLMIITFAFNVSLNIMGLIASVSWNMIGLLIYMYEYSKYHETTSLYVTGMSLASLIVTFLFWLFVKRVQVASDELKARINTEKRRRLSREETNLINEAVQRTALIVRHNEMPGREIISETLEFTRATGLDTLTTLPNRTKIVNHINELIDDSISKSQASPNSDVNSIVPIYVIHISMDHSETFTLTEGHRILDLFLQSMAHRIREIADSSDMVGRVSGTEFAIVTHRGINEDSLEYYIDSLRKAAESSFKDANDSSIVTFSAGYAQYPRDGRFPGQLMSKAEAALGRAHRQGGNKIISYSTPGTKPTGFSANMHNSEIREAINNAFNNNELYMVYQPRTNRDNELTGFEAFIRWDKAEPAEFLDAAVLSGDIYRLGKFTFTNAMNKLKEINMIEPSLVMTINLSTIQLRNSNILADIMDAANKSDCNLENLIFDIPEESILIEPETIKPVLEKLSDMGIQLSLDNFGRGYSSLNNIPLLPMSAMTLDGNFTSNIIEDPTIGILTRTIIELLDEIDIPVSATAVGDEEQYKLLYDYGCSYFQGQYIHAPLKESEIKNYILNYMPGK